MPNKPAKSASKALVPITRDQTDPLRAKHKKITDRQAELVEQLLHSGASITATAEAIGANRSWATITLKKLHVQEYMQELALAVMGGHAARALATMGNLLDTKSDYLKFEVARDLMDRAGLKAEGAGVQAPAVNIQINLG